MGLLAAFKNKSFNSKGIKKLKRYAAIVVNVGDQKKVINRMTAYSTNTERPQIFFALQL